MKSSLSAEISPEYFLDYNGREPLPVVLGGGESADLEDTFASGRRLESVYGSFESAFRLLKVPRQKSLLAVP